MSINLQKLKELEAAATPVPWEHIHVCQGEEVIKCGEQTEYNDTRPPIYLGSEINAMFIEEMRNQLPALIARIEWLEEFLAREEEQVNFWEKRDAKHQERIQELEADAERSANNALHWKEKLDELTVCNEATLVELASGNENQLALLKQVDELKAENSRLFHAERLMREERDRLEKENADLSRATRNWQGEYLKVALQKSELEALLEKSKEVWKEKYEIARDLAAHWTGTYQGVSKENAALVRDCEAAYSETQRWKTAYYRERDDNQNLQKEIANLHSALSQELAKDFGEEKEETE